MSSSGRIGSTEYGNYANSALYRWWKPACILAWVFYIVFQLALGLNYYLSESPLCPYTNIFYGKMYWYSTSFVLGGYFLLWGIVLLKIIYTKPGPQRVSYFLAFNILSICCITNFIICFDWGGFCIDPFGVALPVAIWPEWITVGPFMFFITVTLTERAKLSLVDWVSVALLAVSLVFGFGLTVSPNFPTALTFVLLGTLCYLPTLYMPFYLRGVDLCELPAPEGATWAPSVYDPRMKRFYMMSSLAAGYFVFPLTYLLAHLHIIDFGEAAALWGIFSVLTKGLYSGIMMDMHVDAFIESRGTVEEEQRANMVRRAFFQYIFQEVRSPLGSLSAGLELLAQSDNLDEVDRESLEMMKGASDFMRDILNDVLSMQGYEEGKLELKLDAFNMKEAVKQVLANYRVSAASKNVKLRSDVRANVPRAVIGDRHRVEQVVSNLVSNAIKFSPSGKTVRVLVAAAAAKVRAPTERITVLPLAISVEDQGPGMSEEGMRKILGDMSQSQRRPGQMSQGQGSGLGLSLCRQIVSLHGGTIQVAFSSEDRDRLKAGSGKDEENDSDGEKDRDRDREPASSGKGRGRGCRVVVTIPFNVADSIAAPESPRPASIARYAPVSPREEAAAVAFESVVRGSDSVHTRERRRVPSSSSLASLMSAGRSLLHQEKSAEPHSVETELLPTPLPVSTATPDAADPHSQTQPQPSGTDLLVVDDVASNRKMLQMLLKKLDLPSDTAEDGLVAVDRVLADVGKYRVVFMDNLMPNMNGVAATRAIRSGGFKNLVVGVTGNVMDEDVKEYLAAGADMVVAKPMRMPVLSSILKHAQERGPESRWQERMTLTLVGAEGSGVEWAPRGVGTGAATSASFALSIASGPMERY